MSSEYFSVVFRVENESSFHALSSEFTDSLAKESWFFGGVVVAISRQDEIARADAYEIALLENEIDLPEIDNE